MSQSRRHARAQREQRRLDPSASYGAVLIQGSRNPVVRGVEPDGFDYVCSKCGAVIVENTVEGELWEIAFWCSTCGTPGGVPAFPPGMPLGPTVGLPDGRYMIGGTVDLQRGSIMVGWSAIERRKQEMGHTTVFDPPMAVDDPKVLDELVTRARALLGPVFDQLEESDRQALQARDLTHRHRLMELIEATRLSAITLRQGIPRIAIGSIAELKAVVDSVARWRHDPGWPGIIAEIESDLHHPLMTLVVASYLADAGNGLAVHVDRKRRAGDLRISLGSRARLAIEVKTPLKLRRPRTLMTAAEAYMIVRKAFNKAGTGPDGQLGPDYGATLVIGGFDLPQSSVAFLEQAAGVVMAERPNKRQHVAATLIVSLDTVISPNAVNTAIQVRSVLNRGYTGSAQISLTLPEDRDVVLKHTAHRR